MRTGRPAASLAKKFGSPSRMRSSSAVFGFGARDGVSCVSSEPWSVATKAAGTPTMRIVSLGEEIAGIRSPGQKVPG